MGGEEFSRDAVVTASIFHGRGSGLIIFVEVGLYEFPLHVYVDLCVIVIYSLFIYINYEDYDII